MTEWSIDLSDQEQIDELKRSHIVFISHTSLDYGFIVRELISVLYECHLDYHAENSFRRKSPMVAELYRKAITRSLHRCKCCLVVVSNAAIQSEWVKYEVNEAFVAKMPLIALSIDGTAASELDPRLEQKPLIIYAERSSKVKHELSKWLKDNTELNIT